MTRQEHHNCRNVPNTATMRKRKTAAKASRNEALQIFAILAPALVCTWVSLELTFWHVPFQQETMGRDTFTSFDPFHERSIDVGNDDNDETRQKCFSSSATLDQWLSVPRLNNANQSISGLDEATSRRMLVDVADMLDPTVMTSLLRQTLSDTQSPLLTEWSFGGERSLNLWITRLLYLAIYWHQHRHALSDAYIRMNNVKCNSLYDDHFNYHCPDAKFLVVKFYKHGIGANMRLHAVPALMAGIATNRVVLFVNNAPTGPTFLREPWTLASCARRDAQCFFMPATPCVITQNELQDAHVLQRSEMRYLFRHGHVPREHVNDRVLILHLKSRPVREPENLRPVLHNITVDLIHHYKTNHDNDVDRHYIFDVLYKAADQILQRDTTLIDSFSYFGIQSPIFRAMVLYATRPNPFAHAIMDNMIQKSLDANFSSAHALGIPIRASDKCGVESECMTFGDYLSAAEELWQGPSYKLSVIVTTESRSIMEDLKHFQKRKTTELSMGYDFVLNKGDVLQDTGFIEEMTTKTTAMSLNNTRLTADDAMLSAITSLRLQLKATTTLGNCCSNFHLLLSDLIHQECGAAPSQTFTCLQDHPNPKYKVCCSWDKTPECLARSNVTSRDH